MEVQPKMTWQELETLWFSVNNKGPITRQTAKLATALFELLKQDDATIARTRYDRKCLMSLADRVRERAFRGTQWMPINHVLSAIYNYLLSGCKKGSGVSSATMLVHALDQERLDDLITQLNRTVNKAVIWYISEGDKPQSKVAYIGAKIFHSQRQFAAFFYESAQTSLTFIREMLKEAEKQPQGEKQSELAHINVKRFEHIENKLKNCLVQPQTPSSSTALEQPAEPIHLDSQEPFLIKMEDTLSDISKNFISNKITPALAGYTHPSSITLEIDQTTLFNRKRALENLQKLEESLVTWIMNHPQVVQAEFSEKKRKNNSVFNCFYAIRSNIRFCYPGFWVSNEHFF